MYFFIGRLVIVSRQLKDISSDALLRVFLEKDLSWEVIGLILDVVFIAIVRSLRLRFASTCRL